MTVKDKIAIGLLNKDYELLSWNEQGEITQIEGMLTICFSVVSPCSHLDNCTNLKKMLYLIVRIPYLVNMSLESIQDVEKLIQRKNLTDEEYSEILDWMITGYEGDITWKNIKPNLDKLSQNYRELKNKLSNHPIHIINGLRSKKEIAEEIQQKVNELLEKSYPEL